MRLTIKQDSRCSVNFYFSLAPGETLRPPGEEVERCMAATSYPSEGVQRFDAVVATLGRLRGEQFVEGGEEGGKLLFLDGQGRVEAQQVAGR